jgi:hypothetical protein
MGERMQTSSYDYTERPAVRHPYDDGVWSARWPPADMTPTR